MPRRTPTIIDMAYDLFQLTPIWLGPLLAAGIFTFLWFSPDLFHAAHNDQLTRPFMHFFALAVAGILLVAWACAEIGKFISRARYFLQTGIDSIRHLSWSQFEDLIAEHYRQRGYRATVVGIATGDGGIDIELLSPRAERILVQCKHWKSWKVGVRPARELLGTVTSEHAHRGILVTSGQFTEQARQFAAKNATIELIDGNELAQMLPTRNTPPPRP